MRITVYVGADLRKRMDKAKEPVNWSQVACQAFEAKLGEIAARKKDTSMQDIIQRLRASKIAHEAATDASAQSAGREWAEKRASFQQLQRLYSEADYLARNGGFIGQLEFLEAMRVISGDKDLEAGEARELWLEIDPDKAVDLQKDAGLSSFLHAAVDVFDEVQDKLD